MNTSCLVFGDPSSHYLYCWSFVCHDGAGANPSNRLLVGGAGCTHHMCICMCLDCGRRLDHTWRRVNTESRALVRMTHDGKTTKLRWLWTKGQTLRKGLKLEPITKQPELKLVMDLMWIKKESVHTDFGHRLTKGKIHHFGTKKTSILSPLPVSLSLLSSPVASAATAVRWQLVSNTCTCPSPLHFWKSASGYWPKATSTHGCFSVRLEETESFLINKLVEVFFSLRTVKEWWGSRGTTLWRAESFFQEYLQYLLMEFTTSQSCMMKYFIFLVTCFCFYLC